MCLDDFSFATFWERVARSNKRMFSLHYVYFVFFLSYFSFEGGTMGLIALVPGHCLPLRKQNHALYCKFSRR